MQRLQRVCPCSYATQVQCILEEVGLFRSDLQLVSWLPTACVNAKQTANLQRQHD